MNDPAVILLLAASGLAAFAIIAAAALRAWNQWLELRRMQVAAGCAVPNLASAGGRIELADLKERIRKLEAIAAGVDVQGT